MDPASDWVASGGKGALDFDGANDRVEVAQPQYALPLTVNLWARANTFTNAYFVSFLNATPGFVGSVGVVGSQLDIRYGGSTSQTGSLTAAVMQNWTMVTYILTSEASRTMYTNGTLAGTNTSVYAAFPAMSSVSFGGSQFDSRRLNGQIDDITIFSTALTASEVLEIYRRGRGYGIGASPHRSRRSAVAATNRRRRLICGSVC